MSSRKEEVRDLRGPSGDTRGKLLGGSCMIKAEGTLPRAGGSLDIAGARCLHAAVTRSFIPLRARDIAQVAAGHLDHPADAAVEYHLAPSEGKASNLFGGDPWRDRKSVGIGDELNQFRLGTR